MTRLLQFPPTAPLPKRRRLLMDQIREETARRVRRWRWKRRAWALAILLLPAAVAGALTALVVVLLER